MNVKKISAVLTTILLSAAASATDWTGAVDSDWWNTGNWADAPEEPPTGYVGFADWRIKYSAAKKTTVDLGGRTVTLTDNLADETSADWAITLTNGSLRIEAEGKGLDVHNGSSAASSPFAADFQVLGSFASTLKLFATELAGHEKRTPPASCMSGNPK